MIQLFTINAIGKKASCIMNEKRIEQNKKDKGNKTLQLKEKDEPFSF